MTRTDQKVLKVAKKKEALARELHAAAAAAAGDGEAGAEANQEETKGPSAGSTGVEEGPEADPPGKGEDDPPGKGEGVAEAEGGGGTSSGGAAGGQEEDSPRCCLFADGSKLEVEGYDTFKIGTKSFQACCADTMVGEAEARARALEVLTAWASFPQLHPSELAWTTGTFPVVVAGPLDPATRAYSPVLVSGAFLGKGGGGVGEEIAGLVDTEKGPKWKDFANACREDGTTGIYFVGARSVWASPHKGGSAKLRQAILAVPGGTNAAPPIVGVVRPVEDV
jgi:hypothetical protein